MFITKSLVFPLTKATNPIPLSKMGGSYSLTTGKVVNLYNGAAATGKLISFDITGTVTINPTGVDDVKIYNAAGAVTSTVTTLAMITGEKIVLRRRQGGYDVVYRYTPA